MKKILMLFLTLCSFSGVVFGDIVWDTPTQISTASTDASDPVVVIDTSNNATAIWIEDDVIMASNLPSAGSWSSPTAISNVSSTSTDPRLVVDISGDVTAVWIEDGVVTSAVYSGSWGSSVAVSSSGASNPSVVVDDNGEAVAVWVRSGFVEASQRNSGTWSLVSVLSAANSDNPSVAISSFGTAIAAWHTVTSGNDGIVTSTLTVGGSWATPKNVFTLTPAFKHNFPKVALDQDGNAIVAWIRYNLVNGNAYQNVQILDSTLTQGANNWAFGQFLSQAGIRNPADLTLDVLVDASGDFLAVWTNSYDGETFTIETAHKRFGAASFNEAINPNSPSIYSFGIHACHGSVTALMVFMEWDGTDLFIQSQESDINNPVNQAWTSSQTISDTGVNEGYPSCGISLSGSTINSVAVWVHNDGLNNVIVATSGTSTSIDPPSSVSASQSSTDLGVYVDYFNTITWSASSDPNVVQYNLYRNGVFFAGVDFNTFSFEDNNQVQGGTVTYGVAAYTSDNRQSEIIEYTLFP